MIKRVSSSLPSFKTLEFTPGLNILLAERTAASTQRDTRNGAGKSSLIEIVHFLTGSNAGKDSIFRVGQLAPYSFEIEMEVADRMVIVSRSGATANRVALDDQVHRDPLGGTTLSNTDWRDLLGRDWFRLREDAGKFSPSFRSLFSYFARRQADGGFDNPFMHTRTQSKGDQQVNLAYLLDLDWRIPQELEQVRTRERSLREFKSLQSQGILGATIGTAATLRTQLAVAERRVTELMNRLAVFQVVEEYRSLEEEASALTRQIADLANANALDQQLIDEVSTSFEVEQPPSTNDLGRVYAEAGTILPVTALARFEDAVAFNASVVRNRRSYLESERRDAQLRIEARTSEMGTADRRRGVVMRLLESGGALDHFNALQRELSSRTARADNLRERFESAQRIESTKAVLDRERSDLQLRLQRDFTDRTSLLDRAIIAFETLSSQLYEEGASSLTVSDTPNGPEFQVQVHAKRSRGISQMQIFCFDLTLMAICQERGIGPGFLLHDSHLFDGVDGRQVGTALALGSAAAQSQGFQYIVTMNSDALPAEVPAGFDPRQFVLPVELTDARADGGLFGLRFQ
jgi:uncharacterized protein YydD (DUF2326 family)